MVPTAQVDFGEEPGALQLVQEFIHHRNRERVLDGTIIEGAIVDVEMPTVIVLANQDHRGGERRRRLPDDPLHQHVVALALNLVLEQLRVAIWPHSHRRGA